MIVYGVVSCIPLHVYSQWSCLVHTQYTLLSVNVTCIYVSYITAPCIQSRQLNTLCTVLLVPYFLYVTSCQFSITNMYGAESLHTV